MYSGCRCHDGWREEEEEGEERRRRGGAAPASRDDACVNPLSNLGKDTVVKLAGRKGGQVERPYYDHACSSPFQCNKEGETRTYPFACRLEDSATPGGGAPSCALGAEEHRRVLASGHIARRQSRSLAGRRTHATFREDGHVGRRTTGRRRRRLRSLRTVQSSRPTPWLST